MFFRESVAKEVETLVRYFYFKVVIYSNTDLTEIKCLSDVHNVTHNCLPIEEAEITEIYMLHFKTTHLH